MAQIFISLTHPVVDTEATFDMISENTAVYDHLKSCILLGL